MASGWHGSPYLGCDQFLSDVICVVSNGSTSTIIGTYPPPSPMLAGSVGEISVSSALAWFWFDSKTIGTLPPPVPYRAITAMQTVSSSHWSFLALLNSFLIFQYNCRKVRDSVLMISCYRRRHHPVTVTSCIIDQGFAVLTTLFRFNLNPCSFACSVPFMHSFSVLFRKSTAVTTNSVLWQGASVHASRQASGDLRYQ